jgi:hypothetical protein
MKPWLWLVILSALMAGLAACNNEKPAGAPPDLSGPALIMFYTDN